MVAAKAVFISPPITTLTETLKSPKQSHSELAAAHLTRAREAVRQGDFAAAVVWANLCAETAVSELAERKELDTRKSHLRRSSLARRLFDEQLVDEDLGDLLIRLNSERKHAVYEGLEPDLRGRSWSQVLSQLDDLVRVASTPDA